MNNNSLTLYCIMPEDLSAGLRECTWEIQDIFIDDSGDYREEVKKAFYEAFELITGGGHYMVFSDEIEEQEREIDGIFRESINTWPLEDN